MARGVLSDAGSMTGEITTEAAQAVNLAKTSRTGFEPNRTSRTGFELSKKPHTAAVEGGSPLLLLPVQRQREALEGLPMSCLKCMNLEQALEFRFREYREARSAPFYQVSTELAAEKKVDMERARYDKEEHQLTCLLLDRKNLELHSRF